MLQSGHNGCEFNQYTKPLLNLRPFQGRHHAEDSLYRLGLVKINLFHLRPNPLRHTDDLFKGLKDAALLQTFQAVDQGQPAPDLQVKFLPVHH